MNRAQHYRKIHRDELLGIINALHGQVFMRQDLTNKQSNKDQLRLNRTLKVFAKEGYILKISHGVYAKAMKMDFPNGETKIVLRDSFELVAIEALNKLGVRWELGHAIKEYNRGETTQVPAVFSVQLHSRFRGTISAEGRTVVFEDNTNAR